MRYDIIYNSTSENEEDLILRSFTDDPEIPLGQIKVGVLCSVKG